jgi:hypothetical protein
MSALVDQGLGAMAFIIPAGCFAYLLVLSLGKARQIPITT